MLDPSAALPLLKVGFSGRLDAAAFCGAAAVCMLWQYAIARKASVFLRWLTEWVDLACE